MCCLLEENWMNEWKWEQNDIGGSDELRSTGEQQPKYWVKVSENFPDCEMRWLKCMHGSKWSIPDSTPGLGLSCERLIFKKDENILYIARVRGSGLAHSGLLAESSSSCTSVVLTKCPMFWWTKWQACKKLRSCLKKQWRPNFFSPSGGQNFWNLL